MSRTTTKHEAILDALRRRIAAGDFGPGDRLPSDSDLVREFGASRPTVAKAVAELERSGLVDRRRGAGTFVREATTDSKLFGLIIPGLGETEIFEPICGEIARLTQTGKHGLLWGGSTVNRGADADAKGEAALDLCSQYIRSRVSGVFFAPLELAENQDTVNQEIIGKLTRADIPVVLLDRDFEHYPDRSDFDLVGIDNRHAGYLVAEHFLAQGSRRPVFLGKPHSASTIDARAAGFLDRLRLATTDTEPRVCRVDPEDRDAVGALVDEASPDAIACGNDVTAAYLMRTLDRLGIHVPNDVLVAGIDDVKYANLLSVPLTTIHQPCEAIGRAAFEAMMARLADLHAPGRDVLLRCRLIARESTDRRGGGSGA